MINDPLMNRITRNMYIAYLVNYYRDFEDVIDLDAPMEFDEWIEENKNLFEINI